MLKILNMIKISLFILLQFAMFIFVLGAPLNHIIHWNIIKPLFEDKYILIFMLFGFVSILTFISLCIYDVIKSRNVIITVYNIFLIIYLNLVAILLVKFMYLWVSLITTSIMVLLIVLVFNFVFRKKIDEYTVANNG